MPHVSDVRATPHADHDPMLIAALAAGDLFGADRDRATALTQSCADCHALHDDLVAIARATNAVPPPISAAQRDFRLTPADARRLRPAGWRRIGEWIDVARAPFTRPAGITLATLGLVGLLVGNIHLGLGGSAAASPAAAASAGEAAAEAAPSILSSRTSPDFAVASPSSAPAASMADSGTSAGSPADGGFGAIGSAAASAAPASAAAEQPVPAVSVPAVSGGPQTVRGAAGGSTPAADESQPLEQLNRQSTASGSPIATAASLSPLELLSIAAIVIGLALLAVSFVGRRRTV